MKERDFDLSPVEQTELSNYFAICHGKKRPFSSVTQPFLREAVEMLLDEGKLVGQYNLERELIVWNPKGEND